jgi:hypothetical protein
VNRILDKVLRQAKAVDSGDGYDGVLRNEVIRTAALLPLMVDEQALKDAAGGDLWASRRLTCAGIGLWTAAGTHCACCGHVFAEALPPPAAISVTSAYQDGPVAMFATRICDSCASCCDTELLTKASGVITGAVYPDEELIVVSTHTGKKRRRSSRD